MPDSPWMSVAAGLPIFRGPVVNGHVSILADGVNSGSGAVVAHAAFDIAGINVSLGDVLIDAAALNKGRQGAGATASADFAPALSSRPLPSTA